MRINNETEMMNLVTDALNSRNLNLMYDISQELENWEMMADEKVAIVNMVEAIIFMMQETI